MAKRAKINLSLNVRKSIAIALGWKVKCYETMSGFRWYLLDPKGKPYNQGIPCQSSVSGTSDVFMTSYTVQPRKTEDEAWADLPEDI